MAPKSRYLLTSLTLLALAGCGTHTPGTPAKLPASTALRAAPQALKPMPVAAALGQSQGEALLAKTRQVLGSATGFSAELMSATEGHYKQGEYTAELRHVSQGYRIIWAKPAKFHAVVFNAPSALMEGATLVTTDGVHCTARASGILGIIPIHADANDPRISNARHHTFDKFAPAAQMQRLTGVSAVWTVLDQVAGTNGAPTVRVKVDGVPRLDKEIDEEILSVDLATNGLHEMSALVKGHPVVTYTFSKFSWNPKTTPDMFVL